MSELTPLGDRVLLKDLPPEDLADRIGSIFLPRSYTDDAQRYMTGEVVSVGPLVDGVLPGMRVIHRQFRDLDVLHLRVCCIDDILGTITKDEKEAWHFHPIGSRVVVEPFDLPEEGKLITPDPWRKPSLRGRITALGPKTHGNVAVGDDIIYPPSIGSALELAGKQLLIYQEDEILATMENETL